tara:strand:- start:969 stop:1622 length:654 start_codon:yes stop_codon:yes gene_type:complete
MAIVNGYCTLAQVKASLRIPASDTVDDALIELAVEAASREIDTITERQFFSTVATRIYSPRDSTTTETDDIAVLTSIKTSSNADNVFDVTWAETDYQLSPLNGLAGGVVTPWNMIKAVGDYRFPTNNGYYNFSFDGGGYDSSAHIGEATVQVTGTFGFATIPTAVVQACVILSSRIFKRNDSPTGVMGFGDLGIIRVGFRDPDIDQLLAPYRRMRFA